LGKLRQSKARGIRGPHLFLEPPLIDITYVAADSVNCSRYIDCFAQAALTRCTLGFHMRLKRYAVHCDMFTICVSIYPKQFTWRSNAWRKHPQSSSICCYICYGYSTIPNPYSSHKMVHSSAHANTAGADLTLMHKHFASPPLKSSNSSLQPHFSPLFPSPACCRQFLCSSLAGPGGPVA
jgi:hypothetical protein